MKVFITFGQIQKLSDCNYEEQEETNRDTGRLCESL